MTFFHKCILEYKLFKQSIMIILKDDIYMEEGSQINVSHNFADDKIHISKYKKEEIKT